MILKLRSHAADSLKINLKTMCNDPLFEFENEEDRENHELLYNKIQFAKYVDTEENWCECELDIDEPLIKVAHSELEVRLDIEESNLTFFKKGGQFDSGGPRMGKPGEPVKQTYVFSSLIIITEIKAALAEIKNFLENNTA